MLSDMLKPTQWIRLLGLTKKYVSQEYREFSPPLMKNSIDPSRKGSNDLFVHNKHPESRGSDLCVEVTMLRENGEAWSYDLSL